MNFKNDYKKYLINFIVLEKYLSVFKYLLNDVAINK